MPFVPQFEEVGVSEITDKLFVIVERDMKPALDALYAGSESSKVRVNGRVNLEQFDRTPYIIAGPERMVSRETENGEWLDQVLVLGAGVVVKDTSARAVKERSEKYARAFKSVVRNGVLELLPPPSKVIGYELEIEHRYFHHKTKGTDFIQEVEFQIRIHFGEK